MSDRDAITKAVEALENARSYAPKPVSAFNVTGFFNEQTKMINHLMAGIKKALAILSALQPSPAREEAEALVNRLRTPRYFFSCGDDGRELHDDSPIDAANFIARHHLGEKS
jgi:hypothetical protein